MTIASVLAVASVLLVSAPATAATAKHGHTLALAQLTATPVVHAGEYWIPVADVGRLARCDMATAAATSYEAWPCRDGGILEVDNAALAGYGGPDTAPRSKGRSSPGETEGFNPQPDPPKTFSIGDAVISRRALTAAEAGWIPLADLAKAMGGKVRTRGERTVIVVRRRAQGHVPLRVGISDGTSKR